MRYGFQGTPFFSSISALEGFSHSRKDEIESLAYSLMYLIDPMSIPWLDALSIEDIHHLKLKFVDAKTSVPDHYKPIKKMIQYARSLSFKAAPDYNLVYQMISDIKLPNNSSPEKIKKDLKTTQLKLKQTQMAKPTGQNSTIMVNQPPQVNQN